MPSTGLNSEIAGRIGHFVWPLGELGQIRNELAGNWVVRIGGVDQFRDRAGDANRVGRGDLLDRVPLRMPARDRLRSDRRQCARVAGGVAHCFGVPRCTGVHITCSIWDAPVASITSRSKPSAIPLACGHDRESLQEILVDRIGLAIDPAAAPPFPPRNGCRWRPGSVNSPNPLASSTPQA